MSARKCKACGLSYQADPKKGGDLCGRLACDATTWDQEQWNGRARMAEARMVSGAPLDDLDREALQRRTDG